MSKHVLLWLLFAALLFSCRNTEIKLDDVDLDAWMRDPGGCGGLRAAFAEPLQRQREKLLRLDEAEVTHLLGKPDENELYVRGQKFYRYYLEPSPVCANAVDNARSLVIRFNAVGLSSEVYLE
ncbi:MAG: hypothetical protein LOY03_12360 [Cyclobacteriaceae bacterium]|jgi:hypothetical protein|nr:hypothetical protein [Cyclobacteriaceae bacterium]